VKGRGGCGIRAGTFARTKCCFETKILGETDFVAGFARSALKLVNVQSPSIDACDYVYS
jgi:hypothetical protein